MDLTDITPDEVVYWSWGWLRLNATIVFTWATMALLAGIALVATRGRRCAQEGGTPSRWWGLLEMVLETTLRQIREISGRNPRPVLPFIATLFLFIATANALAIVPGYLPPTASLSTTAALALCVFLAVPIYAVSRVGLRGYLAHFVRPSPFMLPFQVIGELSRTLALAVRLFGNVMSGAKIAAILLAVAPFVFPVVLQALGLLTGLIQAYIFAILAIVYISSAARPRPARSSEGEEGATPESKETNDG